VITPRRIGVITLLALTLTAVAACAASDSGQRSSLSPPAATPRSTTTPLTATTTTTTPATTPVPVPVPGLTPSTRDRLAVLEIDDHPGPNGEYRREDWPHWADVDGNGCDARQDALVAWSLVPATVNHSGTCRVVAGSWVSPYDSIASNNPSDFDIDHLVPLENAFVSGGWQWGAVRRRAFANDPHELVVASASSNRSKGSDAPDHWRPVNHEAWCAYSQGWVAVKSTWGLTVTTGERDALGQMLDTCVLVSPLWPTTP
jgi:hypothetical protein